MNKPTQNQKFGALDKREAILTRAIELFNQNGFLDTRLEDIAAGFGTGKTNISYHFKSKDVLLDEACARSSAYLNEEIVTAAHGPNGLERSLFLVRSRAQGYADALSGERGPMPVLTELRAITYNADPIATALFRQQVSQISVFLKQGIVDGSVNVRSSNAATFCLLNIMLWLPKWLSEIPNAAHQSAIDGLIDVLRYGVTDDVADGGARHMKGNMSYFQTMAHPEIFNRAVKNQLKRDAFLRTGIRHLNLIGYRNLSLSNIAKDLGVTRGAFYYYIADKDELLERCFERSCDQLEKARTTKPLKQTAHKMDQIAVTLQILFQGHITNLDPLLNLKLLPFLTPGKRNVIESRLRRFNASLSEMMAEAIHGGSARNIDLRAIEQIFLGTIFSASHWRLSATALQQDWRPNEEPFSAFSAYFQPIFEGLSAQC